MGIIDSMTPRERRRPEMIDGSRKRRIAAGAGVQLPEVNRLLKQFDHMQKTMKKMAKGGMLKNMMRGMGGRLPPGYAGRGSRTCLIGLALEAALNSLQLAARHCKVESRW